MQPSERFLLKIERAKKHIIDLESECNGFFSKHPYSFRFEINPQSGEREYYVVSVKDVPVSVSIILGDALNNLRSALDHMCWHLACIGTTKTAIPDVSFPAGENRPDYETRARKRIVSCLRPDAVKAIDALEPYGGGNGDFFYHLARLSNFDKHRLLVTAMSAFEGHTATRSDREWIAKFHGGSPADHIGDSVLNPQGRIFPLKAGDKLLAVAESEVDEHMKFLLNIAFAEPEIVRGNPVLETLNEMLNLVRNTIIQFDAFGLFR